MSQVTTVDGEQRLTIYDLRLTMLLAVDIGNTSIKFGLFEGETLTSRFSIPTNRDETPDGLRLAVGDRLSASIDRAIVCSVVPPVQAAASRFLREAAGVEPVIVDNSFDFGLKISYEPLESLGTDRLVAAFAAVEKYGAPCIVCSLGTATTIDIVSKDREFLGGVIAPGMRAMAEALHIKAARLPKVDITRPGDLLGNSSVDSIRSGVYNGYFAMVSGLVDLFKQRVGDDTRVIATGGNAELAAEQCESIDIVDGDLIMSGLLALVVRQ
jgi:type III pantothenate kinase